MKKNVVIIGGGVAGMQTAITLDELGIKSTIIEKEGTLGGKLNKWDRLFPSMTPAQEVLGALKENLARTGTEVRTSCAVKSIEKEGREVILEDGTKLDADAVVIASGFEIFPAELKEEYGYGIYDNVFTTVDIERMFREGKVLTKEGVPPKKIAILHCVGSRDEKVGQRHCSRVCCITAVKQAIEIKELIPDAEVYGFYMDMRMFGPGYEELYRTAQYEHNIHLVRGRISEASRTIDNKIQIKAEDTLLGRPMKMVVDMLVLAVGMKANESNITFGKCSGVDLYPSSFIKPADQFTGNVCSGSDSIFYAGTVTAPKNIGESLNEGVAAARAIHFTFLAAKK